MKTLSEQEAERVREQAEFRRSHADQCRTLLDTCKDVPVFKNPDPINVTAYTEAREMVRRALEAGNVEFYEVACDHCGTQLVNHCPNVMLTSHPPQRRVGCPGCGWLGSTSVF
jgi:ribosomal protein S27E